ncbi:MAG: flagellar hook-associated protein FlgL [Chthonomonadales bacterium]
MRIASNMSVERSLYDMEAAADRLTRVQEQISSGKQLNRPSDNPAHVGQDLSLRAAQSSIRQFQSNITSARAFVGTADNALSQVTTLLRQARQLAVQGATDTLDPTARQGLADQVTSILKQIASIGNTQLGDRYVFAGRRTTTPPFQATGNQVTYVGGTASSGDGAINVEIAPGEVMQINATGDQAFQGIFAALGQLADHLATGQVSVLSREDLAAIDGAIANVNGVRAVFGVNVQRLDQTKARLDDASAAMTALQSKIEDADIPQAVVALNEAQNAYQAALAATARGFQQSLLDFLK